ncbi:pyridoxal 5'-phosphate synthase glutaminase subunit PdxT [Candidatus Peregrinibacteria bacterium CG22_combo_CG10-13_8_21_14_all_44_10]|nr:MAG: glutamine amidotransferase subunit PdxT [Candidatus Peregrinibacteria bacterium CG2_30_44_17]PIP66002.1 MAG: pyridoxal 5'-phosphate synthase glutaminase subunit PdxT [Candidatus Peregrinibacteria bacterium CG22_combo_CG10-13_8_21_14_all_44_10]PIX79857.1 MAG: pyridoxal 5'-phosphate synthase glutaminase subunit PdxT [Candidatus Peregrinibacteria bacterium CG_4_10_14_3_um_filter_44_21]PJB89324.1 MAG: pyridoxal 5'-phosphate synthase glutaminase subunit PdxT [Candidatus Peregrinibacteria bact
MKAGVLAIQGSVIEHVRALKRAGAGDVIEVRTTADLDKVDLLAMPGGESTTIGKLLKLEGLGKAIIKRVRTGMPVYGTCAGAILLAKTVSGDLKADNLGLIDIDIERNAYGRQLDSFESEIEVLGKTIHAVFIRAPRILHVGSDVEILAKYQSDIIMCRQGNILVSTFHPELTLDTTVHKYFLKMCDAES